MTEQSRGSESSGQQGGMFDAGLSAYMSVSSDEYRSVLESGMVVLDTNTLLDLYRYHESTRKEFLRLYSDIGDRLWIPYHVMFEFFERRVEVLDERAAYLDSTILDLRGLVNRYNERLATWVNRMNLSSIDRDKVMGLADAASRQVEKEIRKLSHDDTLEGAADTARDPVLIALKPIIDGLVGRPLSAEDTKEAKAEARKRIEENRPPGFMDANKKGENAEGDYLIWHEVLREASRRRVDVLFVTRDQKKDWWRMEKGQAKGPRRELVAELESHAGTRLYMLRPPSLAEHAPEAISAESVQDAKRVSSKASIGWRPRPGWGTVRDYVEVANDKGGIDIACRFVYDDGADPTPLVLHDITPVLELGEYARGILMNEEGLSIKVGVQSMISAEETFERINAMEAGKRALMFMDSGDIHEDCGWAWTGDYKLVKAAPGLVS